MKVRLEYMTDAIVKLTINRPECKNAVDFHVIEQFDEHLNVIRENRDISIVWIQGEGDTFCSGGDLNAFHELKTTSEAKKMLYPMCEVLKKLASLKAITISYLNGAAVGGGAEIASSTDFTLSNKNGKLGFIQGKLAITTGWGGGSLLKRRVGYHHALYLLASGRVYAWQELIRLGFIFELVENEDAVFRWCKNLINNSLVIEAYKANLMSSAERESLHASMDREVESCANLWQSDAHHQAVELFRNQS